MHLLDRKTDDQVLVRYHIDYDDKLKSRVGRIQLDDLKQRFFDWSAPSEVDIASNGMQINKIEKNNDIIDIWITFK